MATRLAVSHVRKPDGTLDYVVAMVEDISERISASEALANSEKQLRFVLAGAELGFWDWDIAAGTVDRNERWATMLSYSHDEIKHTAQQWTDFIHPDDRERAWNSIQAVLDGRSNMHRLEYRMLCKDGRVVWILDQASIMQRDAQGKPLGMCGPHTDITARKLAEEELRQHRDHLEELVQKRTEDLVDAKVAAEAANRAKSAFLALAQNLSYLCLQLDILRSTNQLEDAPRTELRQKLTALYAAANESYEQVRMTITTLQPTGVTDLETCLCKRVNKLAEIVNLAVTTTSNGPLVPMAPHMKHQIDAIFREALTNIEKHAHATRIHLDFNWKPEELIITLKDNGQGFDLGKVGENHYGLTIMQERAKEIGATFTLNTSPQQGTTILLRIPLAQPLLAARI